MQISIILDECEVDLYEEILTFETRGKSYMIEIWLPNKLDAFSMILFVNFVFILRYVYDWAKGFCFIWERSNDSLALKSKRRN